MSRECDTFNSEGRDFERQRRTERSNFQRNNSPLNKLHDLRSPLRARPYSPNGPKETGRYFSYSKARGRANHYQPNRRCHYERRDCNVDNGKANPDEWQMHSEDFPMLEERTKIDEKPASMKPKKIDWNDMVDLEVNNALQLTFVTPEQSRNQTSNRILTPDSVHNTSTPRSWAKIVGGNLEIEDDRSQTSTGTRRRLDLCSVSSSSSAEDQENRKKSKKKLEFETDAQVLARRQKQIDYGKNTASYIQYIKTVPRALRNSDDPNTPIKQWKYSRRSWDTQIKIWKQKIHLWNPLNKAENKACQSPDVAPLESILDTSYELDLELDLDMDTIPSSPVGSLSDLRSNSPTSSEFAIAEGHSANEQPMMTM